LEKHCIYALLKKHKTQEKDKKSIEKQCDMMQRDYKKNRNIGKIYCCGMGIFPHYCVF